ncbi:MAG: hypothetical protein OHK0039_41290 [Bacteroidia bacterium]
MYNDQYEVYKQLGFIKVKGGNNKSLYPCVDAAKLEQLAKTLFGKEGAAQGEMIDKITSAYADLIDTPLFNALTAINALKPVFDEYCLKDGKYTNQSLATALDMGKSDKLVMVYAMVKWETEGIAAQPLAQLRGFADLVAREFLKDDNTESTTSEEPKGKLCYVSGTQQADVAVAAFADRYNINKIFVQTTQNYANNFDKQAYHKNYQASVELQTYLDRGSTQILAQFQTKIANWPHAIIPQVLHRDLAWIDMTVLEKLKRKSDLLFSLQELSSMEQALEDEGGEVFWFNFVGIESDGNYFKINSLIKDVPNFHFDAILRKMRDAGKQLSPWLSSRRFNFGSMYGAIPVRKKQVQNPALQLFAAVLEQRPVAPRLLYQHFTELILCYRYERYRAYDNILEPRQDDYFDFKAKDAVFQYQAFIYALRQLHQLKEDTPMTTDAQTRANIAEDLEAFFQQLHYSEEQKALFFLGRAMNRIAFEQKDKGNRKRVLEKVNYNGMDDKSLLRLHNDLFEKGKQYDVADKISWDLGAFSSRFDLSNWNMNPQEALFFLLAGYTYRIRKQTSNPDQENSETEA